MKMHLLFFSKLNSALIPVHPELEQSSTMFLSTSFEIPHYPHTWTQALKHITIYTHYHCNSALLFIRVLNPPETWFIAFLLTECPILRFTDFCIHTVLTLHSAPLKILSPQLIFLLHLKLTTDQLGYTLCFCYTFFLDWKSSRLTLNDSLRACCSSLYPVHFSFEKVLKCAFSVLSPPCFY